MCAVLEAESNRTSWRVLLRYQKAESRVVLQATPQVVPCSQLHSIRSVHSILFHSGFYEYHPSDCQSRSIVKVLAVQCVKTFHPVTMKIESVSNFVANTKCICMPKCKANNKKCILLPCSSNPIKQWRFQSCQVTRAGNMCGRAPSSRVTIISTIDQNFTRAMLGLPGFGTAICFNAHWSDQRTS